MEKINCIQDLINWNMEHSKNENETGNTYLFRGMSNKTYELIPKIARRKKGKKIEVVDSKSGMDRVAKLRQYLNIRLPAYGFDYPLRWICNPAEPLLNPSPTTIR